MLSPSLILNKALFHCQCFSSGSLTDKIEAHFIYFSHFGTWFIHSGCKVLYFMSKGGSICLTGNGIHMTICNNCTPKRAISCTVIVQLLFLPVGWPCANLKSITVMRETINSAQYKGKRGPAHALISNPQYSL